MEQEKQAQESGDFIKPVLYSGGEPKNYFVLHKKRFLHIGCAAFIYTILFFGALLFGDIKGIVIFGITWMAAHGIQEYRQWIDEKYPKRKKT